ncbi:MAG: pantoate--beta-alanine ligase [Acidimicrobiales bacterium]|nr:pantoate--beta-alanine ligase [Acidimicrobiales bacterium]
MVNTVANLAAHLDPVHADGLTVGFVPTMGALHDGHASLIDASVASTDVTVVSIFVNPLQFVPGEDLNVYPRDIDGDVARCAAHGAAVVFAPSVNAIYPKGLPLEGIDAAKIDPGEVAQPLEGRERPTHFIGVAEVITRLFTAMGPCRAFFGEKDFQQLQVVRHLVAELNMPIAVVGCPTVRESDGLAWSSRNVHLNDRERATAPVLYRALQAAAAAVAEPGWDRMAVEATMSTMIEAELAGPVDYAAVVDPLTLLPPEDPRPGDELRLLVACQFGEARLIDNVGAVAG